MNIIVWNCGGTLESSFQSHIQELVYNHNLAMLVVMETRVGGDKAREITDRLPFDGAVHTGTIGYAGGLWLLWNLDGVEITPLMSMKQEIHVTVKVRNSNLDWLFTAVYASPRSAERHILWNNLNKVVELHNMPWVLDGDFNEPLQAEVKFGGRVVSVNRSLLFKECLDKCSMIDIGFLRPQFTWTNRREVQALIQKRIDRVFVNPSWCLLYPEAKVVHLTRCHSDHCLVMLQVLPRAPRQGNRPFKFQTCWLSDPTFPYVVSQAWRHPYALEEAIKHFTRDVTNWNKMQFGNIFARKKNIMARLNGIWRKLSFRPSNFLLNIENSLLKELDMVLNQEEELWALKSRVNWMIQSDRNTTFYHVSTLVRRKRNQIVAIKDAMREWLSEVDEVKDFVRNGFDDVYTTSLLSANKATPERSQCQARLTEVEKINISGATIEDEVKSALWSLKAFKALGLDGLHAGFFQRFWLIVGKSVIEEVQKIFIESRVPEYLNNTHIALIPKIQGLETLGNYRPISLYNTRYKIVTKIIVVRLRPYLDKLISPLQAVFVPGRKGVDNAIIAQ